ncbi:hypothetical protein GE061_019826 [Apolygus lucorum]|uniref:Potassium channel tetramerisation-type BTB domain-containing protein n=1 Tax=Apolygus lucorum TaxID=248454 RepID=A0A8S9X9P8_APOLU|nr:hypothetical protein GE061_019826 [Apolygus lucorum]
MSTVVELNVGGVLYTTTSETVAPLLSRLEDPSTLKDSKGRLFLDRDGVLFRTMPKSSKLVKTRSFRKINVREDSDESDGNFAQKTMSNPASKPRRDEQVTDCHTCSMNRKYFDRRGGANKEQQDEVVGKTIHVKNKDISGVIAAKHAAPRSYFVQTEDQNQITTPLSFGKVTEKWPVAAQLAPPGNLQLSSERRPQRIVRPPQRLDL